MTTILAVLNALAAIPKIAGYVESFAAAVTSWYCSRATSQTLSKIADAAALASKAQTDADRMAAAAAWQTALSQSRISSS